MRKIVMASFSIRCYKSKFRINDSCYRKYLLGKDGLLKLSMHIVELIILNIRQFVRVLGLFCNVIVRNMLMSAISARIVKK